MLLNSMFRWYSAAFITAIVVIVCIVNFTSYNRHHSERLEEYHRAGLYLQQAVCTDDRVKAQLGDWNKCRESAQTLQQSVRWLAVRDTALDAAHWLGFSGAHLMDTQMFQLWVIGFVIVVVGLWLGLFRFNNNREIRLAMTPLLPTAADGFYSRTYGHSRKKLM